MKRRQTVWLYWRTEVCWLMSNRGRRTKMARNWWVNKCFSTPHSWLRNSMSYFEPDATQTFSSLVSDCGTTIVSCLSSSPPPHRQWSSSAAVWLLTIKLLISALLLMLAHYNKRTMTCQRMRAFSCISGWWHAHRALWPQRGGAGHHVWPAHRGWHDNAGRQTASHEGSVRFCIADSQQTLN